MNQLHFFSQFSTTEKRIKFLQARGILRNLPVICTTPNCSKSMTLTRRKDRKDGYAWVCSTHKTIKSIRSGSFLENQNIGLAEFILLVYHWAFETPVTTASGDICECKPQNCHPMVWVNLIFCVMRVFILRYQYFRDICSKYLIETPFKIGGPTFCVQVINWGIICYYLST